MRRHGKTYTNSALATPSEASGELDSHMVPTYQEVMQERRKRIDRAMTITSVVTIIACLAMLAAFVGIAISVASSADIVPYVIAALISGIIACVCILFVMPGLLVCEMENEYPDT